VIAPVEPSHGDHRNYGAVGAVKMTPADGGNFQDTTVHGQFTVKEYSEVVDHIRALDERTTELQ